MRGDALRPPETTGTLDLPWNHLDMAMRAALMGGDLDDESGTITMRQVTAPRPVVSLLLPRIGLSTANLTVNLDDARLRLDWTLLCDPGLLVIGDPR